MPINQDQKTARARYEAKRYERWIVFLHFLAVGILGLSLFPMIFLLTGVWKLLGGQALWLKVLAVSFSVPAGYFVFGTTLIFLCVFTKNLLRFEIKPGLFGIHSTECLKWMGYNSLILLANATFLDTLRLSPFQTLFYRLMGAKVGEGVNINTGGLADFALLDIGNNVLIGGGVALICHASERGFIRLAPTRIGNGVSIGLGSVIMPDCEIGDGASVAPCSLLPKGTKIPPKGHWGGNPARDLRADRAERGLAS